MGTQAVDRSLVSALDTVVVGSDDTGRGMMGAAPWTSTQDAGCIRMLFSSTRTDPVVRRALPMLRAIPRVQAVHHRSVDDVLVFTVTGNNLQLEDISKIVDVKWQLVDQFPGRFLDVDIHDSFGR